MIREWSIIPVNSIIVGFRLVELTKLLTTIGHLPKRGVDISLKVLIEFIWTIEFNTQSFMYLQRPDS